MKEEIFERFSKLNGNAANENFGLMIVFFSKICLYVALLQKMLRWERELWKMIDVQIA